MAVGVFALTCLCVRGKRFSVRPKRPCRNWRLKPSRYVWYLWRLPTCPVRLLQSSRIHHYWGCRWGWLLTIPKLGMETPFHTSSSFFSDLCRQDAVDLVTSSPQSVLPTGYPLEGCENTLNRVIVYSFHTSLRSALLTFPTDHSWVLRSVTAGGNCPTLLDSSIASPISSYRSSSWFATLW